MVKIRIERKVVTLGNYIKRKNIKNNESNMSLNYQRHRDFPGGPVVKNLLGNVGGTGLTPGLARFHTLRGN